MAKEFRIRWTPFQASGMSTLETRKRIEWAMQQIEAVCDVKMIWVGSRPDIHIHPYNSNEAAGRANASNIWISNQRNMTGRDGFVLGGVLLHEFGHTRLMRWDHASQDQHDYAMHPWGPRDDWWSPGEVFGLQRRYGKPKNRFWPHEITWMGKRIRWRDYLIQQLIKKRRTGKTKEARWATHRQILNHLEIRKREAAEWRRRVLRWQETPKANTPKISQYATFEEFDRPLRPVPGQKVCGCLGVL